MSRAHSGLLFLQKIYQIVWTSKEKAMAEYNDNRNNENNDTKLNKKRWKIVLSG